MSRAPMRHPADIGRAVEDLRSTHSALVMAACGIAAILGQAADEQGVYYLLMAVAEKMDRDVVALEELTGQK